MHKCRNCESDKISVVLDLGDQPWCNNFLTEDQIGKEEVYPLRLCHCADCELLQLDYTIPKEKMFVNHQYLSGITQTLIRHFYDVAKENKEQFGLGPTDLIMDIGGNDGTQLLQYKKLGLTNILNIESAWNVCNISEKSGVPTFNAFFNKETIRAHFAPKSARLINAAGVFFHLEELHSVIEGIKYVLRDDGVFVVQFMYAGAMIENHNFDTIYHEHLCYYTLHSIVKLLKPYGLEVFDAHYSDIHSGSIVAKVCHSDSDLKVETERFKKTLERDSKYTLDEFLKFAEAVRNKKNNLRNMLVRLKNEGKKVYAYGAPAKGNTLLNYCGIDNTLVSKAVEVNELKIGHYLPQSYIPIVQESKDDIPDYYLLLAHNFVDEILEKNKGLKESGVKFIIPFPEAKIMELS
jgi:SAM-dependent methyltransferase